MEFFAKALDILLDFVLDSILLSLTVLTVHLFVPVDVITDSLAVANGHIKLSYFMRVLAGGWHFDWSLPVKIAVAQRISELLDIDFSQLRLVEGHKTVRCEHAALVGGGRRDEEVERPEAFLRAFMLN